MTWSIPAQSVAERAPVTIDRPAMVVPAPVLLVAVYIMAMPFLAGLARGSVVPLLRPSEVLQLVVTVAGLVLWLASLAAGRRHQVVLRPLEWWLLAMAITASLVPTLWLMARGLPVGGEEILAAFPFVKYAMLYFLVRASVGSTDHLELLSMVVVGTTSVLTVIAIGQALGVAPILDVIGRFYADGAETVVDEGRGTTTLGSSIATGALLSFGTGLALSWGLATGGRRWLAATMLLAVGTVASGQVGSLIALGVVLVTVAHLHGRTGQLIRWGLPTGALASVALWPVVAARLASIDQGTGLPSSWIIRWNNVSELYLPSLLDRGWLLGVSPDAILAPPDVWRDTVYLESGYLLLLWVGGVPLLVATIGFLVSAWRGLGSESAAGNDHGTEPVARGGRNPVAIAAKGAITMMVLLSLIDPHLSLRGGADLFYILVALGLTGTPLTNIRAADAPTIRAMLTAAGSPSNRYPTIRVHLDQVPNQAFNQVPDEAPAAAEPADKTMLRLTARADGEDIGTVTVAVGRRHRQLVGTAGGLTVAGAGLDHGLRQESAAVLWRTTLLVAQSLRLQELRIARPNGADVDQVLSLERGRIETGARLARTLESERVRVPHRVRRSDGDIGSSTPALRIDLVGPIPAWKRFIDVVVGATALAVTAPLLALCAIAVKRSSDGPVLYRQIRVGSGGLPFQILKFRTMYVDNDDSAHREQNRREILENARASKDDADPRITPIGRLLRRTSLDELPQLINVLRSEMSLVGPRPSLLWETELFASPTRRRLCSRPGITGLWQVNGRADLSMSEMLELDVDYVDRMSPGLDLRCLAKTATSVVAGEGAR